MYLLLSLLNLVATQALPIIGDASGPSTCDTGGSFPIGRGLTVYNNLWNAKAGFGGQCSTALPSPASPAGAISWSTTGIWHLNPGEVKSFAHVQWNSPPQQLSRLASLPTEWHYFTACDGPSDVSYDMFSSASPGGPPAFEVMIWLTKTGPAAPISSTGQPIATHNIEGHDYHLYQGRNRQLVVYSFVAADAENKMLVRFIANLKGFFHNLVQFHGVPGTQYLTAIAAGMEIFVGDNCKLETLSYSIA